MSCEYILPYWFSVTIKTSFITTVYIRDRIAAMIRKELQIPQLSLAQVLESATWKGGREIAKQRRPETSGPPIDIESDGTVF